MTTVIEASGWKEDATIGVNLGYLHEAVRFVSSDELTMGVTDENHPLMIEAGPYFACVMPVRLEEGGNCFAPARQGRCALRPRSASSRLSLIFRSTLTYTPKHLGESQLVRKIARRSRR